MATPDAANSSPMSLNFRTCLDQLAEEHERVQARAALLTAENLRLRSLLSKQEGDRRPPSSPWHQKSGAFKDRAPALDPERVTPSEVDLVFGQVLSEATPLANTCKLNPSHCAHMQKPCIEFPSPDVQPESEEEDTEPASSGSPRVAYIIEPSEQSCSVVEITSGPSSEFSSQVSAVPRFDKRINSSNRNATNDVTFPYYFNPVLAGEDSGEVASSMSSCTGTVQSVVPRKCGTVSPQSQFKLSWDGLAAILLLCEMWLIPFQFVFLQHEDVRQPRTLYWLDLVIMMFFGLDIILNFFTGYVEGDETVLQLRRIINHYVKGWFWIDLIATLPYHLLIPIFTSTDGEGGKMARLGKVGTFLKVLRLLKLLRCMRLMKIMKNMGMVVRHAHLLGPVRKLLKFLEWQTYLILLTHVHGIIFAVLMPEEWVLVPSIEEASGRYIESFWWAYSSVTVGSLGVLYPRSDTPAFWMFEMMIASERLVLIYICLKTVFFESMTRINDAKYAAEQQDILRALQENNVSFATQLKVSWSQDDMHQASLQESCFKQLLDANLPDQLRKEVYHEMWRERLASFGLIALVASWNRRFLDELERRVTEAVFPSQKVVFHEGDPATAAYCIIKGTLHITRSARKIAIEKFTPGMWVGENSLVSSVMRRSATMMTKGVTVLMALQGDDFQSLISEFGLMQMYEQFCSDTLWRGVCGCCGSIGAHFSDSCDKVLGRPEERSSNARLSLWQVGGQRKIMASVCNRDLDQFLDDSGLQYLSGTLTKSGIVSLESLKKMSIEQLKSLLPSNIDISPWDEELLSASHIEGYVKNKMTKARATLFHEVSRLQHLMFLSHYKLEAGTEAALMHTEVQQAIAESKGSLGHNFDAPVFLDSENLNNLQDLQERVSNTHNLVLLLTKGVLSRPWVLLEIVTAMREGLQIILVRISKMGAEFVFPDDEFYSKLRNGEYLDQEATKLLKECGVSLADCEDAIREIFLQIAVPYSPHKSLTIRQAEIRAVLKQCYLKRDIGLPSAAPVGGSLMSENSRGTASPKLCWWSTRSRFRARASTHYPSLGSAGSNGSSTKSTEENANSTKTTWERDSSRSVDTPPTLVISEGRQLYSENAFRGEP